MYKKSEGDQQSSNPSNSWPPLSDDERKKVREVLDEVSRRMLGMKNSSLPSDPAAANENRESILS